MDLLNETVLLETKSTLLNLLIWETSHFLCYERLLNMTYVAYKNAFFREMQVWSHCYTVVSYQVLFRLSVYKIPAVYLSGAKNVCFCTIRDFGSPTNSKAVVLLLFIYCKMYFALSVAVLCLYLFCYALLSVHSSFAIILKRKRKLVALLLLSYRCIVTIQSYKQTH